MLFSAVYFTLLFNFQLGATVILISWFRFRALQRVNLAKLGMESLCKYCKHYKLVCIPNSSKPFWNLFRIDKSGSQVCWLWIRRQASTLTLTLQGKSCSVPWSAISRYIRCVYLHQLVHMHRLFAGKVPRKIEFHVLVCVFWCSRGWARRRWSWTSFGQPRDWSLADSKAVSGLFRDVSLYS